MSYTPRHFRQPMHQSNFGLFPLDPETQWTIGKPGHFLYAKVRDFPSSVEDLVVSRGVEERWIYEFGSSVVRPDPGILENFDIIILRRDVERRAKRPIPGWIRKWAEDFEKEGISLEHALVEARQISRKFKTPLSEEVIAEREGRL